MKIIHCADLHLDSKMSAHLNLEQEKEKRNDLLSSFSNMIKYAEDNDIKHIIIAGDLYDKKKLSSDAKSKVLDTVSLHPNITFFYLKGNHDSESLLGELESIPNNLRIFSEKWESYVIGKNVTINGIELTKNNVNNCYTYLNLDSRKINIVVMHGQENEYRNGDDTVAISLKELRNKNIDYLALGHIHSYKYEELDSRGHYCYSGCLEARGFDEIGEHGFVVVDIDEDSKTLNHEFIKITPKHDVKLVNIDIADISMAKEIVEKTEEAFNDKNVKTTDIVKAVLIGDVNYDSNINIDVIEKKLESRCYAIKVEDKTTLKIDYKEFEKNKSLKGEFVKLVKGLENVSEEDKAKIVRYGFQALKGYEIK